MCARSFHIQVKEEHYMPWIISNGKSYVEITLQNQMITTCYY